MVIGRKDSKIAPEVSVTEKDIIPGAKDKSSKIPPNGKTHNLYDYIYLLRFIYLMIIYRLLKFMLYLSSDEMYTWVFPPKKEKLTRKKSFSRENTQLKSISHHLDNE